MGDDAEYWAELQEEEKLSRPTNPNVRMVSRWLNGYEEEVWSWYPGRRINGWFKRLREAGIGSDQFEAKTCLPHKGPSKDVPAKSLRGITFILPATTDESSFDVIVVPRAQADKLQQLSKQLSASPIDFMEQSFADMCREMAVFIRETPEEPEFIFIRMV